MATHPTTNSRDPNSIAQPGNGSASQNSGPIVMSIDSDHPLPQLKPNWKSQVALRDDSAERLSQQDTGESIRLTIETKEGKIWVEGNSLFCACPQCSAPMSVRMWLMTADCWQCETRIQLTREQEDAVERLLKKKQEHQHEPANNKSKRDPLPSSCC